MRFIIPTQELNYLLSRCLNVVPLRPSVPILSNILVEIANGQLTLTASDLTVGIRCSTEVKVLEEGGIALSARKFAQLIKELTAVNVEISNDEHKGTEILADSSKFKLLSMSTSEFPALPDMTGAQRIEISQSALKEVLYRTAFAVSREDNRYVLTGLCLSMLDGEATFTGTDGKRLARNRIGLNVPKEFTGNFIIPLKGVDEMLKNLTDEGNANLLFLPDKIALETDNTLIVIKLLSGEYPDLQRVIPEQTQAQVHLHREELMTLLRQVALFTTEDNHSVKFAFMDGELTLTANTSEVGEGKVSMPVQYHGQKLEIAFNPNYFLDILRHCKVETVVLGVTDAFNPGVITDQETTSSIYSARSLSVLMPMRLTEE